MDSTKVVNVGVAHLRSTMDYNNLREWMEDPDNVYIGRSGRVRIAKGDVFGFCNSIWSNPYKIGSNNREQVIALYRAYIVRQIKQYPEQYDLNSLRGKNLGCWCSPDACHGDVLVELINQK